MIINHDANELKEIIKIVAGIFGIPHNEFYHYVCKHEKIKEVLLQKDISYYRNSLKSAKFAQQYLKPSERPIVYYEMKQNLVNSLSKDDLLNFEKIMTRID
ncbi:MAG: hypothetical protein FWG98_15165 [Candidatus Cloacimonetes bacterium]|nr:hypothetical protein [Candidatus Cloacimonadota bacterium]